jgi:hypothetical protein
VKLTWRFYVDPIFGGAFALDGLPDGSVGNCHYQVAKRQFIANACVGGQYMFACAKTWRKAIAALNRTLDKRSIGLFGEDVVEFAVNQAGDQ